MNNKLISFTVIAVLVGTTLGYSLKNNTEPTEVTQDAVTTDVTKGPGYGGSYNRQNQTQPSRDNCLSDDCLLVEDLDYPVGDLPVDVIEAIDMAIEDEYTALSTYLAVIDEHGAVRPFSMIKGAEEGHIASLKAVYDKYGLEAPENTLIGTITPPTTLADSCALGVQAEIANAALYRDKLLPLVTDYEDITIVFENLMNASQDKHLPSFERCAN